MASTQIIPSTDQIRVQSVATPLTHLVALIMVIGICPMFADLSKAYPSFLDDFIKNTQFMGIVERITPLLVPPFAFFVTKLIRIRTI